MRRFAIFYLFLALLAGLTLGISIGRKGGRVEMSRAIAEQELMIVSLAEENQSYRQLWDALGIGPKVGKSMSIGKVGKGE